MRTDMSIPATVFKVDCLKLMDEVARTGRPVVITRRGRPVAQLAPVPAAPRSSFGYMKDTVSIKGDVVGPTGEQWSADSGDDDQFRGAVRDKPRSRRASSKK
jgi:prevent-host-death family protein